MAGMVLLVLVIVVLILVARELSKSKKQPGNLWNFSVYLNIFKTGWHAVRKNLWIFWILWAFSIVALLQNTLLHLAGKEVPFQPFTRLFSLTFFSFRKFIGYFLRAPASIPFSFGIENSVFLLLAVIFLIKPFRNILTQVDTEPRMQTSGSLLKKNLPFFIAATVIAAYLHISLSIYPSVFFNQSTGQTLVPAYLLSVIMVFWSAFIQALLTGFIFSLFRTGILNKEADRNFLFVSSLRSFRPLFFFFLILMGILHCPVMLINALSLGFSRWCSYTANIAHWLLLVFLFVPYLIVQEDTELKTAFSHNFSLWKQNWRQVIPFLLTIILLVSVINYLPSFLWGFYGTWYLIIVQVVERTVRLALSFWLAASVIAFCLHLTSNTKKNKKNSPGTTDI